MPQHLKITVEGQLAGWLSTSSKSGTVYDVRLRVPEIGASFSCHDVDIGVQRQPQDSQARAEDFRDDFTHARRCIAATIVTSDEFIQLLRERDTSRYAEMKPITMRLMTNAFDRGLVQVHPIDMNSVNVVVIIGVGAKRVCDPLPKDRCELTYEGIEVSGTSTQTERALEILRAIGPVLLQALADKALAGAA